MAKFLVLHASFGCDTGCCGHYIQDDAGNRFGGFSFQHPWQSSEYREFAEALIREQMGEDHVKDLDWGNSIVVAD